MDPHAAFKKVGELLSSVSADRFGLFDVHRTSYESGGQKIGVDLMIPKSGPTPETRPVIVRIHGGFLITGSSLFPAWFSEWQLHHAIRHGAVIISPNYRLLPEVRGTDMLDDMRAFWTWFASGEPQRYLDRVRRSNIRLDTMDYMLLGESAGGYLSIQSTLLGLAHPKVILTLYPMLDLLSDYYTKSYEKSVFTVPNFPNAMVDEFLAVHERKGTPITEADPPDRLDVAFAAVHNGRLLEFLGSDDPVLFPLEQLKKMPSNMSKQILPPICMFHGKQDTAVPVEGTVKFRELLERVNPSAKRKVLFRDGEHGFDAFASLEDDWLRDVLTFVEEEWLGIPNPNNPNSKM